MNSFEILLGRAAWPSVKLLRPATGAFELFWPELVTALLFDPDWAGGF